MPEKGAKIIDIYFSVSRALSAAKQLFGHSSLSLFLIEAADRPTHDFDKLPAYGSSFIVSCLRRPICAPATITPEKREKAS